MTERSHGPSHIAVLGTGLMGAPMARRLLGAGFAVTAWNRSRAKADALVPHGASVAATPPEAVAVADLVVLMLENGAVVTEVLFGPGGAATALAEGATVVDMSSIPPATARDHSARLAARGIAHLDAPVSGGTVGAAEGTLAIMVGGDARHFARAEPALKAMGRPTLVGPSGSGQLAKLANQAIVAVTIGAVAEALLLAAAGGANPAAVREAIRGGFAESRILDLHGRRMIDRDFVPGGRASVQLKDLDTILATAAEIGVELPLTAQVRDRFHRLVHELGHAEVDHAGLLLELEARNPPFRVGHGEDRLP